MSIKKQSLKMTLGAVSLAVVLLPSTAAQAQDITCKNDTLDGKIITGSVFIEGDCKIANSTIQGSVELKENSGTVIVNNGTEILGNFLAEKSSGKIIIKNIGFIPGGVSIKEHQGTVRIILNSGIKSPEDLAINSVLVEKSESNVIIIGDAQQLGDVGFIESKGKLFLQNTSISDLKVEKSEGGVILDRIKTDSDTTIIENNSDIIVRNSNFSGDLEIALNNKVNFTGNDLSLEDAKFEKNNGKVIIRNSTNFSASIIENSQGVVFKNNTFEDVSLDKNSGGTSVVGNTGAVLACTDNSPAPTGSGNTITELADKQCAQFQ